MLNGGCSGWYAEHSDTEEHSSCHQNDLLSTGCLLLRIDDVLKE